MWLLAAPLKQNHTTHQSHSDEYGLEHTTPATMYITIHVCVDQPSTGNFTRWVTACVTILNKFQQCIPILQHTLCTQHHTGNDLAAARSSLMMCKHAQCVYTPAHPCKPSFTLNGTAGQTGTQQFHHLPLSTPPMFSEISHQKQLNILSHVSTTGQTNHQRQHHQQVSPKDQFDQGHRITV